MANPFFSIIVPTYNRPETLVVALKSILKQSFTNYEVIIVNDGSTVDYKKVESWIKQFPFISYIRQENKHLAGARNTGIKYASGDFICFLDDDDIFYENHLEVLQTHIVEKDKAIGLFHTRHVKNVKGVKHEEPARDFDKKKPTSKVMDDMFTVHSVAIHQSIFKNTTFNEELRYWEDIDLWIRLATKFNFYKIEEYTVEYIIRDDNMVSWNKKNLLNKLNTLLHFKRNYKNILDSKYLNNLIADISIGIADFYSQEKNLKTFKYLVLALSHKPLLIFSRYFLGVSRNLIK